MFWFFHTYFYLTKSDSQEICISYTFHSNIWHITEHFETIPQYLHATGERKVAESCLKRYFNTINKTNKLTEVLNCP